MIAQGHGLLLKEVVLFDPEYCTSPSHFFDSPAGSWHHGFSSALRTTAFIFSSPVFATVKASCFQ